MSLLFDELDLAHYTTLLYSFTELYAGLKRNFDTATGDLDERTIRIETMLKGGTHYYNLLLS